MSVQVTAGREVLSFEAFLARCKEKKIYGVGYRNGEETNYFELSSHAEYDQADELRWLVADGDWDAWFSMSLSGHMYRGAPHETDNSCGNCDGARCHTCVETWSVEVTRMQTVKRECRRYTGTVWGRCTDSTCDLCGGAGEYDSRESVGGY